MDSATSGPSFSGFASLVTSIKVIKAFKSKLLAKSVSDPKQNHFNFQKYQKHTLLPAQWSQAY